MPFSTPLEREVAVAKIRVDRPMLASVLGATASPRASATQFVRRSLPVRKLATQGAVVSPMRAKKSPKNAGDIHIAKHIRDPAEKSWQSPFMRYLNREGGAPRTLMNDLGITATPDLVSFTRDLRSVFSSRFDTQVLPSKRSPTGALRRVQSGLIDGFLIRASAVRSARPALAADLRHGPQLLLTLAGGIDVAHNGRIAALKSGDMVLTGSGAPCVYDVPNEGTAMVMVLPSEELTASCPDVDTSFGRMLPGQDGIGFLLRSLLRNLAMMEAHGPAHEADRSATSGAVTALLRRLLDGSDAASTMPDARARTELARMRRWIGEHAADPHLRIDDLATAFGRSRRGLYRLLAQVGKTPHQWLCHVRLDLARERLLSNQWPPASVTRVAFETGFNDVSHFSRLFKQRFGILPSHLRR